MRTLGIEQFVDIKRYPILDESSAEYQSIVNRCLQSIADKGCCSLSGFITKEKVDLMIKESEERRKDAVFTNTKTNVYFSKDDQSLPINHPKRIFFERKNQFIAGDSFSKNTVTKIIFHSKKFQNFVRRCMGEKELYEYKDPIAQLAVNILSPNNNFPWHFDTNEYTTTIVLTQAEEGGIFEYVPFIRTPESENFPEISALLNEKGSKIVHLELRPGDLQLFKGRFSLHRVTKNKGSTDRLTVILAYASKPNIVGTVERTKQVYGRALPVHYEAEKNRVRNDNLSD
tara:strand:- start:589 stop:1446 length:858 start_codon:yes stop_codon:yes gene_type:complete